VQTKRNAAAVTLKAQFHRAGSAPTDRPNSFVTLFQLNSSIMMLVCVCLFVLMLVRVLFEYCLSALI
jgi:hypothetical protein